MKKIEYNGMTYLINPTSEYLNKTNTFQLAKENVGIFFKNRLNYDAYFCLTGELYDLLKQNQPTQKNVDKALIWGTGYEKENSIYSIKSCGETSGDHYMSVLRYDYDSGMYDKVVNKPILIKYSMNFKDVLITMDDINELFRMICSKSDLKKIREDNVIPAIRFYHNKAKSKDDRDVCINQIVNNDINYGIKFLNDVLKMSSGAWNSWDENKVIELLSILESIKENKEVK